MTPPEAGCLVATRPHQLGFEAELAGASLNAIRFKVVKLAKNKVLLRDGMWVALPGLPVAVEGIVALCYEVKMDSDLRINSWEEPSGSPVRQQ